MHNSWWSADGVSSDLALQRFWKIEPRALGTHRGTMPSVTVLETHPLGSGLCDVMHFCFPGLWGP